MKKIIGLIFVALVIIGVAGGGTFALLTDTETSTGNTFTAGTLNLTVNTNDGANTVVFTVADANPGQSGTGIWTLVNAGNLAGDITLESISVADAENYNPATDEAEAIPNGPDADTTDLTGGGELAANMDVVLFVDNGGTTGTANNGIKDGDEVTIYSGKLNAIAGSYDPILPLAAAGTTYVSMTWSVASGVNNTIMGDSATLNMTFALTYNP